MPIERFIWLKTICTCWEDYFRRVDVVATKLLICFGSMCSSFLFSMKVAGDHVYTWPCAMVTKIASAWSAGARQL